MIETYGVDLAALERNTQFVEIRDKYIPHYEELARKHEEALATNDKADEALGKLADAINGYQKAKLAFREAFKKDGDAAPSAIRFLSHHLPPDVTLEQFRKFTSTVVDHVYLGADAFRPFVKVFEYACGKWSEHRKIAEKRISSYRLVIEFWQGALDLIVAEFVFDHAAMKFKTKVCREIAKIAKGVISGGEIALRELENGCKPEPPDPSGVAHIKGTIMLAENRAKVFGDLKGYIEQNGIEAACEKWHDAGRRIISTKTMRGANALEGGN